MWHEPQPYSRQGLTSHRTSQGAASEHHRSVPPLRTPPTRVLLRTVEDTGAGREQGQPGPDRLARLERRSPIGLGVHGTRNEPHLLVEKAIDRAGRARSMSAPSTTSAPDPPTRRPQRAGPRRRSTATDLPTRGSVRPARTEAA